MVFDETQELVLVCESRTEMKSYALGIVVFKAIVEFLVVTEIEALLLEFR